MESVTRGQPQDKTDGKPRRDKGMGAITQLSDGRYQGRLDLGYVDGKRKRKAFYGKTEAEVKRALLKAAREHEQGTLATNERLTVGQFLTRWLEDAARATIRQSTFDSYARLMRLHVEPIIGRRVLAKLTPLDLSSLYLKLLDRDLSPRTVQYVHAVIHRALSQAVRWNMMPRNPADLVDAPRPDRHEVMPLNIEQANELLAAAKGARLEALYAVAVMGGLRLGELLTLKWGDLDWTTGELHVRRSLGRTSAGLAFSEPKTAKGRRSVVLPALALGELREHRTRQLEERLIAGAAWDNLDLIFPNEVGRPIERQNLVRRSFARILAKAGLPKMRFHDLRHTSATLLLSLGEHPKVVQERLGHATIGVTMDIYSHLMPTLQRGAASKLDTLFSAK